MKIRKQFAILIFGILVIPLLSAVVFPLYYYLTSPQRHLLKGYEEIRKLDNTILDDEQWQLLKRNLESIPRNVQTAVYHAGNIIISNIDELKAGTQISYYDLYDYIRSTNNQYDYQFQSLRNNVIIHHHMPQGGGKLLDFDNRVFVISRSQVDMNKGKNPWPRFSLPIFAFIFFFEAFVTVLIVKVSKNMNTSIMILEESTEKIASGALDTKIEPPNAANLNEITSLTENLEKMRLVLKEDRQKQTKFIMGISHDLRTPVALIKGYTEAITDGVVTDPQAILNSLDIIHTKADQLEAMINDLINYVKLDNKQWLKTLENIEIKPFINDFGKSMKQVSEVYKRKIVTDINLPEGIRIPMDKALFTRALENLLSNALRYTIDGDTIQLSANLLENEVHVSISDTGRGISEEDLTHIYDMFYRGTNSRREQGMGIGLTNVRTIVDSHGWKIDVCSKLDKGTMFTIRIPVTENSAVPENQ